MSGPARRIILAGIFALAAVMFFSGINWGLPSTATDSFLFGDRPVWTGAQIMKLAGAWDDSADRGADIAMHLLSGRQQPIVLNDTDAKRAEIIRRFRLYSAQPDEMITFRSLSAMKPNHGDFDPRFYQYGGLWVYPIGGLLKFAGALHLVTFKSDLAFYLDHPEAFARFYLVARCYSAIWGLVGVAVIYAIGLEWTGRRFVGLSSAALYAVMPVVVNMAHEAKPHLAGAVLTLSAVLMAMRFMRTGKNRDWILTGIACGAAFGMVLTGVMSFAVIPVMTLLRPIPWMNRIRITMLAGLIGAGVFVATNPYLPINLIFHHSVVKSNVGNYGNFYKPQLTAAGLLNAVTLMADGMSTVLLVAGIAAVAFWILRYRAFGRGWLLTAPAALIAMQYVLLAHDQAAEYGRFAITLDIILAISAAAVIGSIFPPLPVYQEREHESTGRENSYRRGQIAVALLLCGCTGLAGLRYVGNFVCSTTRVGSRLMAAEELADLNHSSTVLAVWSEPAPYCLPPVNLFSWKIVLLPRGSALEELNLGGNAVSVQPVDRPGDKSDFPKWATAAISWANKPFEITDHSPEAHGPW